jgi:hypothetical protein
MKNEDSISSVVRSDLAPIYKDILSENPPAPIATPRITFKLNPVSDYRIYVEVEDGRKGVFDMKSYLDRGIFRELKDVNYFNQVDILFGAVTWPNEQDIAPETLLAEMLPLKDVLAA